MKIGQAKALWKVPELWKNQKAVFPQLLGPSVHTSHNAGCYWDLPQTQLYFYSLEVGTHSAWMQEIIAGEGHEVVVANPRLMEGSKRRKRKNDRIDAKKLARLGRGGPQVFD